MSDVNGARSAPLAEPVRLLLYAAAVLVFLAGTLLFVFPLRTAEYFAWTIASPMTSVFLGASYWSAMGLELMAARARAWSDARIAIPAVFAFTTTTLVVTLVHLDLFHLGSDIPLRTKVVAWAWIAVYVTVPILMILALVAQRRHSTVVPAPAGLPESVRATLGVLAVSLCSVGVALLLAPESVAKAWPWTLTPLTARAIGAWLIGLGVAAGHGRLLDDRRPLRALGVAGLAFGVLQVLALLRHGDQVDWDTPEALAYLVVLAVLTAVGLWLITARPERNPQ